jgi:hypothetical protein
MCILEIPAALIQDAFCRLNAGEINPKMCLDI